MAKIISSNSIDRERIVALKERKKLARQVEVALESKKQADLQEKKRLSDHRIATKMAEINGTAAPAPLQAKAPVAEPEVVAEPVTEAAVDQEAETVIEKPVPKQPAKRTYKKRTKK